MRRYADVVLNSQGVPQTTATVTVTKAATPAGSGALATIYSDDGITATSNPVSTDSNGRFAFYVADGRYDLKAQLNSGANYIVADQDITSLTEAALLESIIIVDGKQYTLNSTGLNAAVAAAGTTGTVLIPKAIVMNANVIVPSGVTLQFFPSGSITTTGFTLTINGPIVAPSSQIFLGTGTLTLATNSDLNALWFPGVDAFAQINNAMAAFGNYCKIFLPPGNYNISTTLLPKTGCKINLEGTRYTYTGTTRAIWLANVSYVTIHGGELLGPATSGSTIGLQLGIGSGGNNTTTSNNYIYDMIFYTFGTGFQADGYSLNGTYWNTIQHIFSYRNPNAVGNGIGFNLIPTAANFFNDNTFISCGAQWNTTDGWVVDGANGNVFDNCDAENNSRYGLNFPGATVTQNNYWSGGWFETNTTADVNWGSSVNVFQQMMIGPKFNSATKFTGNATGTGNYIQSANVASRGPLYTSIWTGVGANYAFTVQNQESPASGLTNTLGVNRASANNGAVVLGTPEYPIQMQYAVTTYGHGGITTSGCGLVDVLGATKQTGLVANLGNTTLYTTTAGGGANRCSGGLGTYKVCVNAYATVTGTATAIVPNVVYNTGSGTITRALPTLSLAALTNAVDGCVTVHSASSQTIVVNTTGYSGTGTYGLDATVEQMQ